MLIAVAVAAAGVLLGLLWAWLAPRVPLISDGKAVYLKNTEGEQAIGADGWFAILGLAFGALSAGAVFLLRRSGGIALVVALAAGSLAASVIGWRLGIRLGPTSDVVAHAKAVGQGVVFDAPLRIGAKGVLLAWPLAAMAVHLGLTALFGPRDPEPVPHWPGPEAPRHAGVAVTPYGVRGWPGPSSAASGACGCASTWASLPVRDARTAARPSVVLEGRTAVQPRHGPRLSRGRSARRRHR
ncbi:hypothetical protein GCM10020000_60170 [Streptomyces olivoverticillatus]